MTTAQEPFLQSGEALDLAFVFADQGLGLDEIIEAAISSATTAKNFNRLLKMPNGQFPEYVRRLLDRLEETWDDVEREGSLTTWEVEIAAIMCALRQVTWDSRNTPQEEKTLTILDRISRNRISSRLAKIASRLQEMDF